MALELILVVIIILSLVYLGVSLVIVPARQAIVIEELGSFKKVLYPGVHVLNIFTQKRKSYKWSYPQQNGQLKILQGTCISFENVQMDIPPISCLTNDQIQMKIDVTIVYNIVSPEKAVYETDDVLNLFYQRIQTIVRSECNKKDASDVTLSRFELLVPDMITNINNAVKEKGIHCTQLILQEIIIDPLILKANETIYVSKRQQAMLIESEKAENERKLNLLEFKSMQARRQHQLDIENAEAEHKRNQILGYTPEYLLRLAEINALEKANVVYAPRDFFLNSGFVMREK